MGIVEEFIMLIGIVFIIMLFVIISFETWSLLDIRKLKKEHRANIDAINRALNKGGLDARDLEVA